MKNIEKVAECINAMDEYLRKNIQKKAKKNKHLAEVQLWENTFIKKQIDKRNNSGTFDLTDHLRAMVYSMLTSNSSWERFGVETDLETGIITYVDEIFKEYKPKSLKKENTDNLEKKLKDKQLGNLSIKKQVKALIENIDKLESFSNEKDCNNIDDFYKKYITDDGDIKPLIKKLSFKRNNKLEENAKLVQLGESLVAEYLRNVGYDIPKPDTHICRILGSEILGCSDKKRVPKDDVFDIIPEIAKLANKSNAEIDYILWSYCAKGFGGVCTKKEPKCEVCVVKEICNKYLSKI